MELVSEKARGKHHRDARPALEHHHKHERQPCSTGATEIHDQRPNHAALTELIMAFDPPVAYFLITYEFPGVFRCYYVNLWGVVLYFFCFFGSAVDEQIKAATGDLKPIWMQERSYFPAHGINSLIPSRNG